MMWRRRALALLVVVLVLSFVASVVWGIATISSRAEENCARISRIVDAGTVVLEDSGASPGLIAKWQSADCP